MEGILWYRKIMNESEVKVLDTCVININIFSWDNGSDGNIRKDNGVTRC